MATTNLNVRVDENLKKEAETLFAELGLNLSSAITIFLKSSVDYRGIPFEIRKTERNAVLSDEALIALSKQLISRNREAYEELAK